MSTLAIQSTGYQTLTLDQMHESSTNPRRTFEPNKLAELADFVPRIVLLPRRPEVA